MTTRSIPLSTRAPFVIGVTGNVDPQGYDASHSRDKETASIQQFRKSIIHLLDWLFAEESQGELDPMTGCLDTKKKSPENRIDADGNLMEYRRCWRPLGLQHTPVVFLSSLAPGVDTLVAETVLDYAESHPHRSVSVRAPLPFPVDVYRQATTFHQAGTGKSCPNKLDRFDNLLERLRAQQDWSEEDDLFCIHLSKTKAGDPRADLTDPTRRNTRYRAAGEYVAAYSDLLLAVYDHLHDGEGQPDNLTSAGSNTIAAVKQRGVTWDLLADANSFAWADNGPVLRMNIRRQKATHASKPIPQLAFLHPLDAKPDGSSSDALESNPQWQQQGDYIFRRILRQQEDFNNPEISNIDNETREFYSMLLGSGPVRKEESTAELDKQVTQTLDPAGHAFARALRPLAEVRRRGADQSAQLETRRMRLLERLICLIGFAALFLGMYEHWHRADAHHDNSQAHAAPVDEHGQEETKHPSPHSNEIWWRSGLLMLTLACLACSAFMYRRYLASRSETRRFDSRAIGEALRVQIYWCLAGLGRSVPANYMQRQRSELDWIRYIVSGITFPYETWRTRFDKLAPTIQNKLLHTVRQRWMVSQKGYFRNAIHALKHRIHLLHVVAWACSAAGVMQIVLMLLSQLPLGFGEMIYENHGWVVLAALVLSVFSLRKLVRTILSHPDMADRFTSRSKKLTAWVEAGHQRTHREPSSETLAQRGLLRWLFSWPEVWSLGMLISSLVFVLPIYLPKLTDSFPDRNNWWIIATGASLLTGALTLAWAERNFYAEQLRQYTAMVALYRSADRRLNRLLTLLDNHTTKTDPNRERLLMETQDLIYRLGCEALDENAEWLILHRARPLEPFMAG